MISIKSMEGMPARAEDRCALLPKPRAVDVSSSCQFEEEIGAALSENGLFTAMMEFSVQTSLIGEIVLTLAVLCNRTYYLRLQDDLRTANRVGMVSLGLLFFVRVDLQRAFLDGAAGIGILRL